MLIIIYFISVDIVSSFIYFSFIKIFSFAYKLERKLNKIFIIKLILLLVRLFLIHPLSHYSLSIFVHLHHAFGILPKKPYLNKKDLIFQQQNQSVSFKTQTAQVECFCLTQAAEKGWSCRKWRTVQQLRSDWFFQSFQLSISPFSQNASPFFSLAHSPNNPSI